MIGLTTCGASNGDQGFGVGGFLMAGATPSDHLAIGVPPL